MAIELWRGIAAWMVLTAHYAQPLVEGHSVWLFFAVGVNFFFVISGFVFAKAIYAGQVELLPYLTRRLFRIYPLYVCSLLLYYAVTPTHPDKTAFLWQHLLFLHTTHSLEVAFFFNPAYWSLPVEVTFYMAVPLLALLQARWPWVLPGLFIMFIGVKWLIAAYAPPLADANLLTILRFHLVGILPEFLVGIFAYHFMSRYAHCFSKLLGYVLAIAGLVGLYGLSQIYLWFSTPNFQAHIWLNAYFDLACGVCFSLILWPMVVWFNPKSWLLLLCVWAGNVSYGVYLLHHLPPLLFQYWEISLTGLLTYLVYSAVTLVLALVFYVLVENPFRQLGRRIAGQLARG